MGIDKIIEKVLNEDFSSIEDNEELIDAIEAILEKFFGKYNNVYLSSEVDGFGLALIVLKGLNPNEKLELEIDLTEAESEKEVLNVLNKLKPNLEKLQAEYKKYETSYRLVKSAIDNLKKR